MLRFWLILLLLLPMGLNSASAKSELPLISAIQQGDRTVFALQSDVMMGASHGSLTISSSLPLYDPAASSGWHLAASSNDSMSFELEKPLPSHSIFAVHSNNSRPTFSYHLSVDSKEYVGSIAPADNSASRWFTRWTDEKEKALSAFVPEGWQADLQIIRPYNSLTGFVFFARGNGSALAYVFYPFMPLHIIPSSEVCARLQTCQGVVASEKVKELSLGNAPLVIGNQQKPREYFDNELMPVLQRNLDGYAIDSAKPVYALRYDEYNKAGSELDQGLQLDYHFNVKGHSVMGKSMLLISNHTSGDFGYWTGFIVGVESSTEKFDDSFQDAATALLTLQANDSWTEKEEAVLYRNAMHVDPSLVSLSGLLANESISNVNSDLSTAVHALVNSYNETRTGPFVGDSGSREVQLPLFNSTKYWYQDGDTLVGRKVGRNILNTSTLEPLY